MARFKDNLEINRLYDISDTANITMVQKYLLAEREAWLSRGRTDPSKMKRDAIVIPEKVLLSRLIITKKIVVGSCTVFCA